jgi:NodT family efflux transporter outer membrane factor (OMF) lipoprotein
MVSRTVKSLSLLTLLSLTGCYSVGPDFVPPTPALPAVSFFGKAHPNVLPDPAIVPSPPPDPRWWARFHDPILTALEEDAVRSNLDLLKATAMISQSRYQRGATASAEFPMLSGNGKYSHGELLSPQLEGPLANSLSSVLGPGGYVPPFSTYQANIDAAWELDLWGRVRRQVESADAQIDVSEDQRRDMLVSLLAEVARDYIQLRSTQAQIQVANDNLKSSTEILQLTQTRNDKGLTNGLDVENAAGQVESIKAQLPQLHSQEIQAMNALSLLLDEPPGALQSKLGRARPIPLSPARVALGIPSELARRRPDIRAAEAQLHAATADIGVAVADFYPSVKLNGSVGYTGLELQNTFKATAVQYMIGPSVSVPIFQGGKLRSTLFLKEAQQQAAAISYQKIVLQAWHDVVNALIAYRDEQQRHDRLKAQIDHARQALSLSRDRYRDGVDQFVNVLDAERTLYSAQQQLVVSQSNISTDLVQLYKALGGGWELTFPSEPKPDLTANLGLE